MRREVLDCIVIILITAVVGGIGFFGSHETSSFGLFGDAAHIVGDGLPFVGSLILTIGLPYEEQEGMIEDAIKWMNRLFIGGSGVYVLVMGIYHLAVPHRVESSMVFFALIVLVGNSCQAYFAERVHHVYDDHNTHRGLMAHLWYDIGVSAVVVIGGVAIALYEWQWVDPILSIALGLATPWVLYHIEHHDHEHSHTCAHGHHHH